MNLKISDLSLYLGVLMAFYFLIHLPLDLYMMKKRDRSFPLTDYGINSSDKINLIMGSFSILMWLFWFLLSIPSMHRGISTSVLYLGPLWLTQYLGLLLVMVGVLIACWGRIARGIYASSWGLSQDTPLITSGPFKFIRHPSYLFYILMFVGLILITLFLPSILLLGGIWAYNRVATDEERLLTKHFGDTYSAYRRRTGKFLPWPKG